VDLGARAASGSSCSRRRASPQFNEVWRLDLGPIWHAERGGVPPVHAAAEESGRVPEWRPWPGEEVTLAITRPGGTEGQSLTIEKAAFVITSRRAQRRGHRAARAPLEPRRRARRDPAEGATLESLSRRRQPASRCARTARV
jgi:hypothetical protein